MKKLIFLTSILILIFCLMGCNEQKTELVPEKERPRTMSQNTEVFIWTDEETGVQYIVYCDYCGMGGITPRLNADGTLYIETESGEAE